MNLMSTDAADWSVDTNRDGSVTPADILTVINRIRRGSGNEGHDCDVNRDGRVTPNDAIIVINRMRQTTLASIDAGGPDTSGGDDGGNPATPMDPEIDPEEPEEPSTDQRENDDEERDDRPSDDDSTDDDSSDEDPSDEDPADDDDESEGEDESDNNSDDDDERDEDDSDEDDSDEDDSDSDDESDGDAHCPDWSEGRHGRHARWLLPLLNDHADELFDLLDRNENGEIEDEEVPFGLGDRLAELNLDTDESGGISLAEIDAFFAAERADWFAARDANADGVLTEDEVRPRVFRFLERADVDDNAAVSLPEIETYLQTRREDESRHSHPIARRVLRLIRRFV